MTGQHNAAEGSRQVDWFQQILTKHLLIDIINKLYLLHLASFQIKCVRAQGPSAPFSHFPSCKGATAWELVILVVLVVSVSRTVGNMKAVVWGLYDYTKFDLCGLVFVGEG